MTFENVQEAFNYYRNFDLAAIEQRAKEIEQIIEKDPAADVSAYNIELSGMNQAKQNIEQRAANAGKNKDLLKVLTGAGNEPAGEKVEFGENVLDTKEYRSAFYKKLLGRDLSDPEQAAMSKAQELRSSVFNAAGDTGAVIPTQTLNEIVKKARTQGGLLSAARAFSIPSYVAVPVGTPASRGTWHTEGATVDSDKANITSVTFAGYEIMKLFSISAKVQTMSIDGFESYLTQELNDCVMETIADALVNGTGASQGTGILTGITWNTDNSVTAKTAIAFNDVIETVAKLPRGYANGAAFAMNNATLYRVFYGMLDGNKRPIFTPDVQNAAIGKILGYNVIVDDYIPDNVVIFGNFGQYLAYNLPAGILIETSRDSSFRSGLIDYRATAIADCKPIVPEAFIKLSVGA